VTTPNTRRSTAIGLDLNLEAAAAAARWRKTKGLSSESISKRVSKPKSPHGYITSGGPAITMRNEKSFLGIRFILSCNFRLLWESYLFNHFFRDAIRKKGIFEFLN
jgi:hypothetical protein